MGLLYSRPSERVENAELSYASYRYPAKSGNYFSSHFIMGDQTFAGTQPESFLFGDNSDLNFLAPRPVAFPYPETHRNEPTKLLRSLVNLRKDSLKLKKNSEGTDEDNTYYIDFVFDADVKCSVTVHYLAVEDLSTGRAVYTTQESSNTSRVFAFDKGANQSFGKYGKFHLLRPSDFKETELLYSENKTHIPVVIHIQATEEDYSGHSNVSLANIEKLPDETYGIKVLKQKQMVDGVCYILHEIYGLESREGLECEEEGQTTNGCDDDDYDNYADENVVCIACMSDPRDTLMLPCKHLCVCSDCASSLRSGSNNCPICRAPFHALLQLCAYQRARTTHHQKSHFSFPGYEKVDLFDALNAFNVGKRRESTREIVRRVSARARSRSGPTSPKPSQRSSSNERMTNRSSVRNSRNSHGSHKRDRVDSSHESADSFSRTSLRNSKKYANKSHVLDLEQSGSCVVEVKSVSSVNRFPVVETGVDVGQDNLGMDSLDDEENKKEKKMTPSVCEIDETSDPVPKPLSPYEVPLPGTPLDKDLTGTAGSVDNELQNDLSADFTRDSTSKTETLIV